MCDSDMQRCCHNRGIWYGSAWYWGQGGEPFRAHKWSWLLPSLPTLPFQQYSFLLHMEPFLPSVHAQWVKLYYLTLWAKSPIRQPWVLRLQWCLLRESLCCPWQWRALRQTGWRPGKSLAVRSQHHPHRTSIHAHWPSILGAGNLPCPLPEMNCAAILIFSVAQRPPPAALCEQHH